MYFYVYPRTHLPEFSTDLLSLDTHLGQQIIETHRSLRLDPNYTAIVGSAAMALYSIPLVTRDDMLGTDNPRPAAIDYKATPKYIDHIFQHGTPYGLKAEKMESIGRQTSVRIGPAKGSLLPTILTTRYDNDHHNLEKFERGFGKYLPNTTAIVKLKDGTDLRIITPRALARELRGRVMDPKAANDLTMVCAHFSLLGELKNL